MEKPRASLSFFAIIVFASFILATCTPQPTAALPAIATQAPTVTVAPTFTHTANATATIAATPTLAVPPEISLRPGEMYFRVNGVPQVLFSRNIAAYTPDGFNSMLSQAAAGGSRLARIQLSSIVMGGAGFTNSGAVDEDWAIKWEQVFDQAQAAGIDIMLVFSGWYDWNTHGYSNWANNPLNSANGGLAQSAHDLFQKDSKTQTLWLSWLKTLVNRWQSRQNIAIWEIYSEVNLTDNVTEAEGIYFINQAASIIHSVDPKHRPITASLADFGQWNQFYSASSIDFINIHPYPTSGQLDLKIIHDVPLLQAQYHKPVMIGESGLSAETPDSNPPTLTTARNAPLGIQHAIWAGVVSGSMNARSLYWEDSYAIYFPTLTYLLNQYKDTELAAAHFIQGVDFSGFTPLAVSTESTITGAAVGSPQTIIGWFRDATCEPPDWNMQPVVSKQTVMITVPGPAANWRVYFYDTATGSDLIGSTTVVQNGGRITIPLPDFKDAIAFKLNFQSAAELAVSPTGEPTQETPGLISTDPIAGKWTGTIFSSTSGFSTQIDLSIQAGCQVNQVCGTVSTPQLCSGNLVLTAIDAPTYIFIEQDMTGVASCTSGGSESLQLLADGSLSFNFKSSPTQGGVISSSGTLKRP